MIIFVNNYDVRLTASVSPGDTSIEVSSTIGVPNIPAGDYIKLTLEAENLTAREIVHLTDRVGNTLTIARGMEGTSPGTFIIGDIVQSRNTAGAMNEFIRLDGSVVVTGTLFLNPGVYIRASSDPIVDTDLANKGYVDSIVGGGDDLDAKYLIKNDVAGDTMTGPVF